MLRTCTSAGLAVLASPRPALFTAGEAEDVTQTIFLDFKARWRNPTPAKAALRLDGRVSWDGQLRRDRRLLAMATFRELP
jgi:hypothetical protein